MDNDVFLQLATTSFSSYSDGSELCPSCAVREGKEGIKRHDCCIIWLTRITESYRDDNSKAVRLWQV